MHERLRQALSFPLPRGLTLKRAGEGEADFDGIEAVAIGNDDLHASALLPCKKIARRREARGDEAHAGTAFGIQRGGNGAVMTSPRFPRNGAIRSYVRLENEDSDAGSHSGYEEQSLY